MKIGEGGGEKNLDEENNSNNFYIKGERKNL